ncbi:MAG: FkbM family methyltransferase [Actinobacteria bacterium]|nr:FkbM family methyltransferase [Actinomycetota bacterium]
MLIDYQKCAKIFYSLYDYYPRNLVHIGAHLAEEAASYSSNHVQRVLWVEANSALIVPLCEAARVYNMQQQVLNTALWHSEETRQFNVANNGQSSSLYNLKTHSEHYPNIKVEEQVTVQTMRFDRIIERSGDQLIMKEFDFVNIDTQGSELGILMGFGNELSQSRLKALYLEVNNEELYEGIPLVGDIDVFLKQYDFHRVTTVWTKYGWGDALYIRNNIHICE